VLSQTFRSMIHSRMALGMKHYERAYPDTDIVLIEPDHRDPELYLANTFSYASAATWPNTRSSRRARCCARARPACPPSWHATASPRPCGAGRPQGPPVCAAAAPDPGRPRHCNAAGSDGRSGPYGGPGATARAAAAPHHGEEAPRRTAERILEVTLELFNRFGEPNVSTTLISAELNISPGNLYYHYPAKDELINSLFDRFERALNELLNASDGVRDVEDAWFFMHSCSS
jgi:hypothetical protein